MNPIAEAASVILTRRPGSEEVFAVRRAESLRFFGGYLAFPGGRTAEEDAETPVRATDGRMSDPRRAAAARELFEETGVLIACRTDGNTPSEGPDWEAARHELNAGRLRFAEFLAREGLYLRAEDFAPAGSLVTPPFSPVRFDTAFFVVNLPPGQRADVWAGELDEGFWTTADDLLTRWERGACLVSPPTVTLLETIRGRPADELPARVAPLVRSLSAGAIPPIFFAPGVQMIPLRTVGLPPSSYTNAFLVGGEKLVLLDPGADDPDEQRRLFEVIDARLSSGARLESVVLTHWHPDHVGAAEAVARRHGVPVLAHPLTANRLEGKVRVSGTLGEGGRLELGKAPDGAPWHLEAVHTPGHAAGHLAFYDPHYRLLFAADMVSMLSSVVIAPPDGDLAVYLQSLERLKGYDCRMLLPGHGGPTARPREVLDECIAHRLKREGQLVAALAEPGPHTAAALAERLYRGLAEELVRLARWQVEAGLEKLRREGRAEARPDGEEAHWRLTRST